MTRLRSMFLAAIVLVLLAALARPTAAIEYPWCAQYGSMGDGGRNCGFSTLEQCMATVSGIGGGCQFNLFYQGDAQRPAKRERKRRNRDD